MCEPEICYLQLAAQVQAAGLGQAPTACGRNLGTPAEAEHRETDKAVPGCGMRECDGGVGEWFPSQFLCSGGARL